MHFGFPGAETDSFPGFSVHHSLQDGLWLEAVTVCSFLVLIWERAVMELWRGAWFVAHGLVLGYGTEPCPV